jgi:N6-adenosine-specific RNA methylase IME4
MGLIAGAHRLAAVRKLGHDTIDAIVRSGIDLERAQLAEIDENLVRADLTPAERSLHLAEREKIYEKLYPETKRGVAGGKARHATDDSATGQLTAKMSVAEPSAAKASFAESTAQATGKSTRTIHREVERAAKIADLADVPGTTLDTPDELDALAKLPAPVQAELIARAKAGESVTAKPVAKQIRRDERERDLAAATEAASKTLGTKLYGVIYADPPWPFDVWSDETGMDRAAANHYPVMEVEAIKALPIPAAESCVLFLWATVPQMPAALEAMAAWGFTYKSAAVWDKLRAGTGHWLRSRAELLLIGARGEVPAPVPGQQMSQVIQAARTEHSEKPDIFATEIARLFPHVPKLEMFARKKRPGWDSWGNEAGNEVAPAADLTIPDDLSIPAGLRRTPTEIPSTETPSSDEYDAADDFAKSYELALDTVRERRANKQTNEEE